MNVITEEQKLLQKAAIFDEAALAEIYDRYQNPLYRYALHLLGSDQLAEDCISDSFLRFLKVLRQGNIPGENLRAYLYRIVHNWIVDHYRKKCIDEHFDEKDLPDEQPRIEDSVIANMEIEKIRQALHTLTLDQQQVIVLKYIEGWPNEDIALLIGKRAGAVKALAHRAIRTLRKKCRNMEWKNE